MERLFEEFKKWLLKPGKPSLGLRAFLDIKLDEYFPEIRPFEGSWEALGAVLDNMAELRDGSGLSDTQAMDFAFAALLCGNADGALDFLTRITNENHLLKNVPLLLPVLRPIATTGLPPSFEGTVTVPASQESVPVIVAVLPSTIW